MVRERALALVHALEPLGQIEARLAREVVERHVPIPQLQAQHVPLVPREGAVGVTQLDREPHAPIPRSLPLAGAEMGVRAQHHAARLLLRVRVVVLSGDVQIREAAVVQVPWHVACRPDDEAHLPFLGGWRTYVEHAPVERLVLRHDLDEEIDETLAQVNLGPA